MTTRSGVGVQFLEGVHGHGEPGCFVEVGKHGVARLGREGLVAGPNANG